VVKKELRAKRLVAADSHLPAGGEMSMTMEIRAYREKPQREGSKDKPEAPRALKRNAQVLWDYLVDTNKPSLANAVKSKA
jgi:hypothetical protein